MVLDDKIGKGTVYILKSPSWGGMCIFIELFLLNNKRQRALFLLLCSDMYEVYFE